MPYTTTVTSSEPVLAVAVAKGATATVTTATVTCAFQPPLEPGPMLQLAARREGLRQLANALA